MSSGFLSKMFKQEIPTNAIAFDYAVFGMQSFEIHNPIEMIARDPRDLLERRKKRDMKHPTTTKKMYDVIVNKGP